MTEVKDFKLLKEAIELGIIDLDSVKLSVSMMKHEFKTWQGKNGYYYTYILENGKRRLIKKKEKEALLLSIHKGENTLSDAFYNWIDKKKEWGELDDSTIIRYKNDFKRFLEGSPLDQIGLKDLSDYILEDFLKKTIKEKSLTAKSYQNLKILLNGSLKFAKKRGLTTYSIGSFFRDFELSDKVFKKKDREEIIFSKGDRLKLLNYLRENESVENLALILLTLTGLRIGELSALKKEDNIEDSKLYIRRTEVKVINEDGSTSKTVKEEAKQGHNGIIFIPIEAQEVINKAKELSDGEFLFSKNGRRLTSWQLSQALRKACKKAEVTYKSPHKMRKTYASLLLSKGVDEAIVKEQMRHRDISTTRSYYHFTIDSDEEKLRVINEVIGV